MYLIFFIVLAIILSIPSGKFIDGEKYIVSKNGYIRKRR